MSDKEVLIRVENLEKSFGDHQVIKGISTTICRGDVVAVIGPSGCGKSTFLRSMNCLEDPTGGRVTFEGTNITDEDVDINLVREKIGMVFQQFNLFPNMTVRENIMLAPVKRKKMTKEEAAVKADELLDRIGLSDKADSYPAMLSGGQKQLEEESLSIQQEIEVQEQQIENIEKFVQKAHKYVHIEELTPYALRELVSAIYVDAPDKSSGKRVQHIHIKYDGLGYIPLDELEAKEKA